MAGINGMNVTDLAMKYADNVLSGNKPGVWATFKYQNGALLDVDTLNTNQFGLGPKGRWQQFSDTLTAVQNDVRYGIVEFSHTNRRENVTRSKRIFVLWAPTNASTRMKMMATMHLKDVKTQLTSGSCSIIIQANCAEDLKYNTVLQRIRSKTSVF